MTPLEAINTATGASARVLGLPDVGTLQTGRLADLIAVEGDPSVRIQDLQAQKLVMKGGKKVAENGVLLF